MFGDRSYIYMVFPLNQKERGLMFMIQFSLIQVHPTRDIHVSKSKIKMEFSVTQFEQTERWAPLTRNRSDMGLNPMKGSFCFFEQETLTSLLSTVWYQERSQA